jgi:hypothetical protein
MAGHCKRTGLQTFLSAAMVLSFCCPIAAPGAQADYYDCRFGGGTVAQQLPGSPPLLLRFMLNTKLKTAFRIDTPVARPVKIFVADDGRFSLLDHTDPEALLLVTIHRDGRSLYSRHLLDGGGAVASPMGLQLEGWCYLNGRNAWIASGSGGGRV